MVIAMTKNDSVSSCIRRLRRKKGLTQAELATKILVSRETVRDWELNRYEPSCQILVRLSNFFRLHSRKHQRKTDSDGPSLQGSDRDNHPIGAFDGRTKQLNRKLVTQSPPA